MGTTKVEQTAVEAIKRSSNALRGGLAADLANDAANVSTDSEHLLKFHGIYAQDDRDVRRERRLNNEALEHIFMVRVGIPGGLLSATQWLALDGVADEVGDGTLRLTTRQAVQFHGVAKTGLRPLVRALDAHLLTSFAACGDVVRNVVACPSLTLHDPGGRLAKMTDHLATAFKPATSAYWELFVNGEAVATRETRAEHTFYEDAYLPRKFKMAIAHPHDNCVDVFAQDLGLIPGTHPDVGEGFTVVVGGGLGRSYANEDTFARLADHFTFVTDDEVDQLIAAVLLTYRDLGDRTDRRRARMKYVIADLGIDAFADEVAARYGMPLRAPLRDWRPAPAEDHLGWAERADGTWQLGIRIGAGRVRDADGATLRSAVRELAQRFPVAFAVTPQQDLVVADIPSDARTPVDRLFAEHGVRSLGGLGPVERNALACVALPTCGQALAEAERCLPEVVGSLEGALAARGLAGRHLQLRMTGCPNGCARPAVAEVGVVGRTKNSYDLYLGGGPRGDRLASLYREKVKLDDLEGTLGPLLDRWRDEAIEGEAFGDFFVRVLAP